MEAKPYHDMVTESVMLQLTYNEELTLLQQYAKQFKLLRTAVIELKPRNGQQRLVQCVLSRSEVWTQWNKDEIRQNPVLGVICGRFYSTVNMVTLTHKLLKTLNDVKGKIGRFSLNHANTLLDKLRNDYTRKHEDRYNGKRGKVERSFNVEHYVSKSARYQSRLSWIRDIKNVGETLELLPVVDDWKRKYAGTNKLAYINAVNAKPYVRTIVCSQLLLVGNIRHMETDIPVYAGDCITWSTSLKPNQRCYFLGKTGSNIVDGQIRSVEWYHVPLTSEMLLDASRAGVVVIEYLRQRLGYVRNQQDTLANRRKELASYARKLVWLETMSMLDSKSAGNCLPGTIQFCQTLGVPITNNWSDTRVDTRTLLRAWKQQGYGVNRLLLPAIDSAVNRVKKELLSVTACYVPSVVR
jgi:hypothetical protein